LHGLASWENSFLTKDVGEMGNFVWGHDYVFLANFDIDFEIVVELEDYFFHPKFPTR
jgi:hypothetical protein